jgi:hypothetical protein
MTTGRADCGAAELDDHTRGVTPGDASTTHHEEGEMPATKKQQGAAAKAAATKNAAAAKSNGDTPSLEPSKPRPPATPQATALFTDKDGKTLQGHMAVLQVVDVYDAESGDLAGMPRTLSLRGVWPTGSHTAAAQAARDARFLAPSDAAVTLNARFVSRVDALEPEGPAEPTPEEGGTPESGPGTDTREDEGREGSS